MVERGGMTSCCDGGALLGVAPVVQPQLAASSMHQFGCAAANAGWMQTCAPRPILQAGAQRHTGCSQDCRCPSAHRLTWYRRPAAVLPSQRPPGVGGVCGYHQQSGQPWQEGLRPKVLNEAPAQLPARADAAHAQRQHTDAPRNANLPSLTPASTPAGAVRRRTQRLLHLHWLAGAHILRAAAPPRGSPAPQAAAAAAAVAGAAAGRNRTRHGIGACWCGPIKWHSWQPNGQRRQRDASRAPWKPCRHSGGLGTGQPVPAQCPAA